MGWRFDASRLNEAFPTFEPRVYMGESMVDLLSREHFCQTIPIIPSSYAAETLNLLGSAPVLSKECHVQSFCLQTLKYVVDLVIYIQIVYVVEW